MYVYNKEKINLMMIKVTSFSIAKDIFFCPHSEIALKKRKKKKEVSFVSY